MTFAFHTPDGGQTLKCTCLDRGGIVDDLVREKAKQAKQDTYQLGLCPGSVLQVGREQTLYVVRGTEAQPIVFTADGPVVRLNGKAVVLDLGNEKALQWLRTCPPADRQTLRTVQLAGQLDTDVQGLGMLRGSGVMIAHGRKYRTDRQHKLARSLAAVEPTGLFLPQLTGLSQVLGEVRGLTHLWSGGAELPDVRRFGKLVFFAHAFDANAPADLQPIADCKNLRTLLLVQCDNVTDFSPVRRLTRLEYLVLVDTYTLKDLAALSPLKALRSLVLFDAEGFPDLSELGQMKQLSYLMTHTADMDLTPLKELKDLKVLVVAKQDMKDRPAEFDALRRALPNTEIVGFCVGSLWLLAPVGAMALGLLARRYRPRATP